MSGSLATGGGEDQLQAGGNVTAIELNNRAVELTVEQIDVNRLVQPQELPQDMPALERRGVEDARTALPESLARDALDGNQESFNNHCEAARVTGDLNAAYTQFRILIFRNLSDVELGHSNEQYRAGNSDEGGRLLKEAGRHNQMSEELAGTSEEERERHEQEMLSRVGEGLNDEQKGDALRAAAESGYFSPQAIQAMQRQWGLEQEEEQPTTTIQFPVDEAGAFQNPVMLSIQANMRRQLDDIRDMQQRGDTPDQIKQSEEYRRLARVARSTSRADEAISRIGGGEDAGAVATAITPGVYARMQLDDRNFSVVPVRRQIG